MLPTLAFLVVLTLVGYRIILAVPPLLHTPLMSGMNAFSGVTVLGALIVLGLAPRAIEPWGAVAAVLGMTNVVGGFWVTDRMLRMFRAETHSDAGES